MVLLAVKTASGHHGDLQRRASEWSSIGRARRSLVSVAPTLCLSFSLLFAARGREQEEEGGSHRPGDHELGESVSAADHSKDFWERKKNVLFFKACD